LRPDVRLPSNSARSSGDSIGVGTGRSLWLVSSDTVSDLSPKRCASQVLMMIYLFLRVAGSAVPPARTCTSDRERGEMPHSWFRSEGRVRCLVASRGVESWTGALEPSTVLAPTHQVGVKRRVRRLLLGGRVARADLLTVGEIPRRSRSCRVDLYARTGCGSGRTWGAWSTTLRGSRVEVAVSFACPRSRSRADSDRRVARRRGGAERLRPAVLRQVRARAAGGRVLLRTVRRSRGRRGRPRGRRGRWSITCPHGPTCI
jgi:hypothetical protein